MQISHEELFYTVLRDETTYEHFLEVTCGTAAVFMLRIKLTKREIARFRENPENIWILAGRAMDLPDSFSHCRV